jgi:hypothetical protein
VRAAAALPCGRVGPRVALPAEHYEQGRVSWSIWCGKAPEIVERLGKGVSEPDPRGRGPRCVGHGLGCDDLDQLIETKCPEADKDGNLVQGSVGDRLSNA